MATTVRRAGSRPWAAAARPARPGVGAQADFGSRRPGRASEAAAWAGGRARSVTVPNSEAGGGPRRGLAMNSDGRRRAARAEPPSPQPRVAGQADGGWELARKFARPRLPAGLPWELGGLAQRAARPGRLCGLVRFKPSRIGRWRPGPRPPAGDHHAIGRDPMLRPSVLEALLTHPGPSGLARDRLSSGGG